MPRGIKLLGRRRDSKSTRDVADEDSEMYAARLDRILDEPAIPTPAEPEVKQDRRRKGMTQ